MEVLETNFQNTFNSNIKSVAYCSSRQCIFVGSSNRIECWEKGCNELFYESSIQGNIRSLRLNEQQTRLFSNQEIAISIFNMETKTLERSLRFSNSMISSFCLFDEERKLCVGTKDGRILICKLETGDVTRIFEAHPGVEVNLIIETSRNSIVSLANDKTLFSLNLYETKAISCNLEDVLNFRSEIENEADNSFSLSAELVSFYSGKEIRCFSFFNDQETLSTANNDDLFNQVFQYLPESILSDEELTSLELFLKLPYIQKIKPLIQRKFVNFFTRLPNSKIVSELWTQWISVGFDQAQKRAQEESIKLISKLLPANPCLLQLNPTPKNSSVFPEKKGKNPDVYRSGSSVLLEKSKQRGLPRKNSSSFGSSSDKLPYFGEDEFAIYISYHPSYVYRASALSVIYSSSSIPTIFDKSENPSEIEYKVSKCLQMTVFFSPQYQNSYFCRLELRHAIQKKKVISLLVDPEIFKEQDLYLTFQKLFEDELNDKKRILLPSPNETSLQSILFDFNKLRMSITQIMPYVHPSSYQFKDVLLKNIERSTMINYRLSKMNKVNSFYWTSPSMIANDLRIVGHLNAADQVEYLGAILNCEDILATVHLFGDPEELRASLTLKPAFAFVIVITSDFIRTPELTQAFLETKTSLSGGRFIFCYEGDSRTRLTDAVKLSDLEPLLKDKTERVYRIDEFSKRYSITEDKEQLLNEYFYPCPEITLLQYNYNVNELLFQKLEELSQLNPGNSFVRKELLSGLEKEILQSNSIANAVPRKKILYVSSPRGAGKTTLVSHLIEKYAHSNLKRFLFGEKPKSDEGQQLIILGHHMFQKLHTLDSSLCSSSLRTWIRSLVNQLCVCFPKVRMSLYEELERKTAEWKDIDANSQRLFEELIIFVVKWIEKNSTQSPNVTYGIIVDSFEDCELHEELFGFLIQLLPTMVGNFTVICTTKLSTETLKSRFQSNSQEFVEIFNISEEQNVKDLEQLIFQYIFNEWGGRLDPEFSAEQYRIPAEQIAQKLNGNFGMWNKFQDDFRKLFFAHQFNKPDIDSLIQRIEAADALVTLF